jgi:hypothetical protein
VYKFRIVEILFLSAISSAVFGNIVLENEYVKYEFAGTNGGLVSMIDKSSSTEHMHVNSDDAMLWSLVMGNNGQYSSKYYTVAASPIVTEMDGTKRLDMTWAIGNISVMVKAVLANNTGIAAFRIFVNNNSDAALKNVKFHLNGFISSGDYDVAHPYDNIGYLHKNLTSGFTSTYPCGFNTIMQFCIFIKSNS